MGNNDTAGCCSSGSQVCFNDKKIVLGGQSLLRKHPFRYRLRKTSKVPYSDLAIPQIFALINIRYILRTSVRYHPVLARSSPLIMSTSLSWHPYLFSFLHQCLCVCVCGSEVSRNVEAPGGEPTGKKRRGRKQRSASLLFYHPLVGKYVIKRAASSEAPGL